MDSIDVVVVPDFSGSAARLFEARTLLFLGSWLEHSGRSRTWPLHLVCIGEPPESVRSLAAKCEARITIEESLALPESFLTNKLRGLDVTTSSDHILLVDVDTLILGDLSAFLPFRESIALAPANQNQINTKMWAEIYESLGVAMPEERTLCLRARYKDQLPERYCKRNECEEMVPYFNSGVLLVPESLPLKEPWWKYSEHLIELSKERGGRWKTVRTNDQVGLAVAMAGLRSQGVAFKELPPYCHGNYLLFWAGVLTFDEVRIFHGMKLYRLGDPQKAFDPEKEIALYDVYLRKGAYPETLLGKGQRLLKIPGNKEDTPAAYEVDLLCRCIKDLNERYVLPAM